MPNTRKLMLQKFGISEARYIELMGFCRQYFEKKKALEEKAALKAERAERLAKEEEERLRRKEAIAARPNKRARKAMAKAAAEKESFPAKEKP